MPAEEPREEAMAEEMRATGTDGRPSPVRPRPARRPNGADGEPRLAARAPWAGTPRNAACPCGSGRKFKHCHGRV